MPINVTNQPIDIFHILKPKLKNAEKIVDVSIKT